MHITALSGDAEPSQGPGPAASVPLPGAAGPPGPFPPRPLFFRLFLEGQAVDRSPAALYLEDAANQFRVYKGLAERALAQVRDEDLFVVLDPESNSLALLIQHMAGNLISRWTDFLTTDGEKPDRDRDSEFVAVEGTTRAGLLARWEEGWKILFDSLGGLS